MDDARIRPPRRVRAFGAAIAACTALGIGVLVACAGTAHRPSQGITAAGVTAVSSAMLPVAPASLCVTKGAVEHERRDAMKVTVGAMRGFVGGDSSPTAELAFTYAGPSATTAPLASGEVRRQIGLKLRAKDSCNLVYVMWRHDGGVVVQLKSNPGKSTHAACGAGGYTTIRAASSKPTAAPLPGERHVLRVAIDGKILRASADGVVVWEGPLPDAAFAFDGPVGVRSDNGTYDFELRVPGGGTPNVSCPSGRHGGD